MKKQRNTIGKLKSLSLREKLKFERLCATCLTTETRIFKLLEFARNCFPHIVSDNEQISIEYERLSLNELKNLNEFLLKII